MAYLAQVEILSSGARVKVVTKQGGSVNLRRGVGLKADVIDRVPTNTELVILGYAGRADNYDWYLVKLPDNKVGYVAGEFLQVIPETEKKWDITSVVHDVSMSIQSLFNWLSSKEQAKIQPVEPEVAKPVEATVFGMPLSQFIIISLVGVGGILLLRRILK